MGLPIPKWGGGLGPGIPRQPKALSLKNGRGSVAVPWGQVGKSSRSLPKVEGGPRRLVPKEGRGLVRRSSRNVGGGYRRLVPIREEGPRVESPGGGWEESWTLFSPK